MAVEVIHGTVRTHLLARMVGDFQARQIGGDLCWGLNTRCLEII
jgi:hypothetical protein